MPVAATAILLLAAGGSSRLGEPKQLLDCDGEPLVRRAARELIAMEVGPVAVVIGAKADAIAAALGELPLTMVTNAAWAEGLGTSIRAGIVWAAAKGVDAVLIVLCDQPDVPTAHLRALLDRFVEVDAVATAYGNDVGVPAVFGRSLFDRLAALPADRGAKGLLADPAVRVATVACEAASVDLDTPDDVRRWRGTR